MHFFFTVIFTPVGFLSHTLKWTLMNWQRTQKDASTAVSTAVDWLIREITLPAHFHENIHGLCWLIRRLLPERSNIYCHRGLVVDVFAFTPQANGSRAWDWPIWPTDPQIFFWSHISVWLMCSHLPKWSLVGKHRWLWDNCSKVAGVRRPTVSDGKKKKEVALIGDCSYVL